MLIHVATIQTAQPPSFKPSNMLYPGPHRVRNRMPIVAAVLGFHVLGLWALQSSLLQQDADILVPVRVVSELVVAEPTRPVPAPAVPQTPPPRPMVPTASQQPVSRTETRLQKPPEAPTPTAIAPALSPLNERTTPVSDVPPSAAIAAAPAPAPTPAPPPVPERVELPSSSAQYLNNPKPPYPSISQRLGEQGKVVLRVFIDTNGVATRTEIRSSSGYERLDQTAVQTALRWRYVPGKRNGVPEAMWVTVPISFVIE